MPHWYTFSARVRAAVSEPVVRPCAPVKSSVSVVHAEAAKSRYSSMFMTPYFHAIREYTSSPTNHMNEEDRRASRVPIRAVRHLHSRGGRPTPGYLNWDDDDGVWRNNHGETPEEGRARQAQKEEAAREREAAHAQKEEAAREREAALCKPAQHSASARQQQHLHPMRPSLVFFSTHTAPALRSSSCSHRGHLRPCATPMSAWLACCL